MPSSAAIARPEIGGDHADRPGAPRAVRNRRAVAEAEAEIVAALPSGGAVVVPAGEPLLDPYLRREDVEVVTYGDGGDVGCSASSRERTTRAWT